MSDIPMYFSSFAGADIQAVINVPMFNSDGKMIPMPLGTLSEISLSTHRPKYEVLSMGSNSPKGYTAGPRVVAGQLVFAMFNAHIMYDIAAYYNKFSASDDSKTNSILNLYADMHDRHEDELPMFDIIMNCCNNDGIVSHSAIWGVSLIDSQFGLGISIPAADITYTYVAIDYKPLTPGRFTMGESNNNNSGKVTNNKNTLYAGNNEIPDNYS